MLIDLATAKANLRVDGTADDAMITLYLGAAERAAAEYLQRNIYADADALAAAMQAVPAALAAAVAAHDAALLAAGNLFEGVEQDAAILAADEAYSAAQASARMAYRGLVINDTIRAAILLGVQMQYDALTPQQAEATESARISLLNLDKAY